MKKMKKIEIKEKDINNEEENEENTGMEMLAKEIKLDDIDFFEEKDNKNYIILLRNDGMNFETCHFKVYVPPLLDDKMVKKHPFDYIDSLNLSVILGLILTKFRQTK